MKKKGSEKVSKMKETFFEKNNLFPTSISDFFKKTGCSYILDGVSPDTVISTVVCNDLKPTEGCLYVPHLESDEEIKANYEKGAVAVLVDHKVDSVPCIIVEDIPFTLKQICGYFYSYINLPVFAVAGSEGKTTTKRMIAYVLRKKKKTHCDFDNFNTVHGLCNVLKRIESDSDYFVFELDESRKNGMSFCSEVLRPKFAAVTNIADAHISRFDGFEGILDSFRKITAGMPEDGIVIINGDDENSFKAGFDRKVMTVGIYNKDCDCVASNITTNENFETEFDLTFDGKMTHIKLSVQGEHNVYNAMMAFLVGKLENISDEDIKEGLLEYRNSGIRQNIVSSGGFTVYADCYNASATSIGFALKSFKLLPPGKGKKVAVLGDIVEIEGNEAEVYGRIAKCVNDAGIDAVITYGEKSVMIHDSLNENITAVHTSTRDELRECIEKFKNEGYTCWLFKASRIMKLEKSIEKTFPDIFTILMGGTKGKKIFKRIKHIIEKIYSFIGGRT